VGRILDWYKKDTGRDSYPAAEDPGVVSVKRIYAYYKKFGHKTEVMGASFRNLGEIIELAGCDLLTIAPNYLAELAKTEGTLVRKLDPSAAVGSEVEKIVVDEAAFRAMHAADRMANDKLAEGIAGFSKALVALETLLGERLKALHATPAA
jgi:transaldolase